MSAMGMKDNMECDVVVIGAGGSGLAAAVKASEKGAKVIVLEKRRRAGGQTVFAEGLVAAESPTQKRLNIKCTKDDLFKIHMYYSHWTLNARLVRALIDQSSETIQWLEERGLSFKLPPLYPDQEPLVWHCPQNYGSAVISAFLEECGKVGVQVLYKTSTKSLLKDKSGNIKGVEAEDEEKRYPIRAKSVVIATGGYGGSIALLKKYCPEYACGDLKGPLFMKDVITGDGIQMAFEAGAANEGLGTLLLHGPLCLAGRNLFGLAIEPDTVWVNKDGERFMEESASFNPFESANGVFRQPGQVSYTIFDEALKKMKITNGTKRPFESGLYSPDHTKLDGDLEEAVKDGVAQKSDSWDEIAGFIGAPPGTLEATMDEYNIFCDQEHDRLFSKDRKHLKAFRNPPYYALKCRVGHLVTIGGIKVNHRMEVLNKEHRPIKGLYAAGVDTGGWSGRTYNARLAGTGCGFAVYSGQIAGENVANYILQR